MDPDFATWTFAMKDGKKQKIGEGASGKVFKARTDRNQTVAVKVVRVSGARNIRQQRRAIRQGNSECELLSKIKHPNVIQFLKFESSADGLQFYIFTELISGDSLFELMNKQQKPFDESQVREFSLQICTALNFLHSRKPAVLHRDIKCSNILLTREGVIKLIDFGIASEIIIKAKEQHEVTEHEAGSWLFMAPEQFTTETQRLYTPKTDFWALGCSVFEMLVMQPPNAMIRRELIAWRVTGQDMPQLPVRISDRLSNFYRRCVAREPEERADTAELLRHQFLTDAVATVANKCLDDQFSSWDFILDASGTRRVIGEGQLSRVFEAFTDRHQTVAVKVVSLLGCMASSSEWQHAIRTVKSNYKVLKSIRHENIVQFLKLEHTPERIYIFTELIAGHSLYDLMQRQRDPFGEQAVKKFSKQICAALNFLHGCQPAITHRGINCSNIMLTHVGVIKLIDFEIDCNIKSIFERHLEVAPDTYKLCFMAPEQFTAETQRLYTPKTDVWALGCSVFEMLVMQPPNRNVRSDLVALRVTGQDLPQLPAGVSKTLSDFYHRCVAREPSERADAEQLLHHRLFLKPDASIVNGSALDTQFTSWDFLLDGGSTQFIGAGGSSHVFKVFTDRCQTVAVKVIKMESNHTFKDEIGLRQHLEKAMAGHNILKSIRHPNIMQFLKLENPAENELRIFTELIAGHSLSNLMKHQQKPIDEAAVKKFSQQICSALYFLHSRRPAILHRSINCSNIMLTHLGEIKLINFRHAVRCCHLGFAVESTRGTCYFMAPELLISNKTRVSYSPKTDVWAFGCTVFEMLAMKPPNSELEMHQISMRIHNQDMPPLPAEVTDSLSDFYRRCVEREPRERADTAELLRHRFLQSQ